MEKQGVLNDKKIVGSPMVHMTCLALVLFAFWMVLSGRTETKFVVYGILTAVVTSWVTYLLLLVSNLDCSFLFFVRARDTLRYHPSVHELQLSTCSFLYCSFAF